MTSFTPGHTNEDEKYLPKECWKFYKLPLVKNIVHIYKECDISNSHNTKTKILKLLENLQVTAIVTF